MVKGISDKKLSEYIGTLYELCGSDVAPCTVAESHRRTGIPLSWCSWILKYLTEIRGDLDCKQIPFEYKESSPLPIHYQEDVVREVWSDAKFVWNPDLVEEKRVNEKIEVFRRISRIGLNMARTTEDVLMEACLRITKNLTKSVFNSPDPDVIMEVNGNKLAVEISIRTINPIDRLYVKHKRDKLPEDFSLLIIAPRFSKDIWKKYRSKIVMGINIERYPGQFPIWKEFSNHIDDFSMFARKVEIVSRDKFVDNLEVIIRQYVR